MIGIQIFAVLFALFMLYISFLHKKRNEFTMKETVAWFILWIGVIFISIWPNSLSLVAKDILNMQRPLDFYIIIAFMFMIGAMFYEYTLIRRLQKKIDDLVTKIAIDKVDKK